MSHSPKVAKNQLLQSVDRLQAELAAEKQINAGGLNAVNWFTKQVDELRDRIALLKQENAALKAFQVEPEITAALKTENAWLQAELKATQGRLKSIQQLLSSPAATAAPIAPAPAPVLTAAPVPTHSAPIATPAPAAFTDSSSIKRNPEFADSELDPDTERALFAIINHNQSVSCNADRWAISVNATKDLLKKIGKSYQPNIQEVLKADS